MDPLLLMGSIFIQKPANHFLLLRIIFFAFFLKKSTLVLLSVIVTLTVSSFKASSSGDGRKSEMTLTFPIGSSVYLIFSFIDFISFPPISGADYSNFVLSVCKPNRHYPAGDHAKTVKPFFIFIVFNPYGLGRTWHEVHPLGYQALSSSAIPMRGYLKIGLRCLQDRPYSVDDQSDFVCRLVPVRGRKLFRELDLGAQNLKIAFDWCLL
jgi:hypothetical protein